MRCPYCGEDLEDEALFCSACGRSLADAAPAGAVKIADKPLAKRKGRQNVQTAPSSIVPAQQKRSRGGGLRGKFPTAIAIVVALAAIAAIAFAVYSFVAQPKQTEPAAEQEPASSPAAQEPAESASSEAPRKQTADEKETIASLDGWWTSGSFQSGSRYTLLWIDAGDIERYTSKPDGTFESSGDDELQITDAIRTSSGYDGPATSDYKTHDGEMGYEVTSTMGDDPLWLFDSDPDALAGTAESYIRITDPETVIWLEERAAALSNGEGADAALPNLEGTADEAQKRIAAIIAGKQVFTGTIMMTTVGQRAAQMAPGIAGDLKGSSQDELALLLMEPQAIEAKTTGSSSAIQLRTDQDCISMADPERYEASDGMTITVTAYAVDLTFPDDETSLLYSASGAVESLTTLKVKPPEVKSKKSSEKEDDEEKSKESEEKSAEASSDGYILAESATRAYSPDELEKLDVHTLFLARNEIYARHGRKFQSEELQKYFGSKSWYKATVDSASFSESMLSKVEIDNINRMRDIEAARNSPYL